MATNNNQYKPNNSMRASYLKYISSHKNSLNYIKKELEREESNKKQKLIEAEIKSRQKEMFKIHSRILLERSQRELELRYPLHEVQRRITPDGRIEKRVVQKSRRSNFGIYEEVRRIEQERRRQEQLRCIQKDLYFGGNMSKLSQDTSPNTLANTHTTVSTFTDEAFDSHIKAMRSDASYLNMKPELQVQYPLLRKRKKKSKHAIRFDNHMKMRKITAIIKTSLTNIILMENSGQRQSFSQLFVDPTIYKRYILTYTLDRFEALYYNRTSKNFIVINAEGKRFAVGDKKCNFNMSIFNERQEMDVKQLSLRDILPESSGVLRDFKPESKSEASLILLKLMCLTKYKGIFDKVVEAMIIDDHQVRRSAEEFVRLVIPVTTQEKVEGFDQEKSIKANVKRWKLKEAPFTKLIPLTRKIITPTRVKFPRFFEKFWPGKEYGYSSHHLEELQMDYEANSVIPEGEPYFLDKDISKAYLECIGGNSCMTGPSRYAPSAFYDKAKNCYLCVYQKGENSARCLIWKRGAQLYSDRIYRTDSNCEKQLKAFLLLHDIANLRILKTDEAFMIGKNRDMSIYLGGVGRERERKNKPYFDTVGGFIKTGKAIFITNKCHRNTTHQSDGRRKQIPRTTCFMCRARKANKSLRFRSVIQQAKAADILFGHNIPNKDGEIFKQAIEYADEGRYLRSEAYDNKYVEHFERNICNDCYFKFLGARVQIALRLQGYKTQSPYRISLVLLPIPQSVLFSDQIATCARCNHIYTKDSFVFNFCGQPLCIACNRVYKTRRKCPTCGVRKFDKGVCQKTVQNFKLPHVPTKLINSSILKNFTEKRTFVMEAQTDYTHTIIGPPMLISELGKLTANFDPIKGIPVLSNFINNCTSKESKIRINKTLVVEAHTSTIFDEDEEDICLKDLSPSIKEAATLFQSSGLISHNLFEKKEVKIEKPNKSNATSTNKTNTRRVQRFIIKLD